MITKKIKYERKKIEETANRIDRYADRFENANHCEKAQHTRNTAEEIRNSIYLDEALEIEKKFILNIKREQLIRRQIGNTKKMDGY